MMIFLWLGSYLYLLSNKTSALLLDHSAELLKEKETLIEETNKKASNYTHELVPIYIRLCQISLCQNDFPSAENYINALLTCSAHVTDTFEQANLYLFAANIFRDFKKFAQAQAKYEKALLISLAVQKSNPKDRAFSIFEARILNNQGAAYLLQGKSDSNTKQRQQDYSSAKECLAKAARMLGPEDQCLLKTVHINLNQCLTEMNSLN